ncbi:MAG: mechanosensitive ion channel [Methylobacterium sp.]|nr:mechanosensitive ion channel [Methylobacterium sp.]
MTRRWRHWLTLALLLFAVGFPAGPAAAAENTAVAGTDEAQVEPATLSFFNRDLFTMRAKMLGYPPHERASLALDRIRKALDGRSAPKVSIAPLAGALNIELNGRWVFSVTPQDVNPLTEETQQALAENAARQLQEAAEAYHAQLESRTLLQGGIEVAVATLVLLVLLAALRRLYHKLQDVVTNALSRRLERTRDHLGKVGAALLQGQWPIMLLRGGLRLVVLLVGLLLVHAWLLYCFDSFPYTRPWRAGILRYFLGLGADLLNAVVGAVPNLLTAAVIFLLVGLAVKGCNSLFRRIELGEFEISWLDRDTAAPTRRLATLVLWLFGIVMAYPYLPGAHTDAFKGMSVLVGLMISLGASSIVGQVFSGVILIYARVFRVGDYVNIAGNEGMVSEIGMYSTRIRTLSGIEIATPNTSVLSNPIKNFSRSDMGNGPVVEATVTIGYDTPWRQVHAMLLEAAAQVPEILQDPKPTVLQTALSDFYVEYRLAGVLIPSRAAKLPVIRSNLHASIQDTFNHYGVQIMSPHYLGDPAGAKTFPEAGWAPAPAKPL